MGDNDEVILTVQDYEQAISEALSTKQIELLQILYSLENKSATAKQLAKILSPNNPATIIANGQIGRTGKAIAEFLNVIPGDAFQDDQGDWHGDFYGWFNMISDGYSKKTGWKLLPEIQEALEKLGLVKNGAPIEERLTTEIQPFEEQQLLREGKVVSVIVNRYERNQFARQQCISHFGNECFICGFDFGSTYGDMAKGFIHVHHLIQLKILYLFAQIVIL